MIWPFKPMPELEVSTAEEARAAANVVLAERAEEFKSRARVKIAQESAKGRRVCEVYFGDLPRDWLDKACKDLKSEGFEVGHPVVDTILILWGTDDEPL